MNLFSKDISKDTITVKEEEIKDQLKSLKKQLFKNTSIADAISRKLKTLSQNLPAMTVEPSHTSYKVIGLVTSSANSLTQSKEDKKSAIDWTGSESDAINELNIAAETKVVNRLKVNASKLGANAVIGVNLDFELLTKSSLSITAQGTAVVFDNPKEILTQTRISALEEIEKTRGDYKKIVKETEKVKVKIAKLEKGN